MQQDAHEFLNYLLNTIADILSEEKRAQFASNPQTGSRLMNGNVVTSPQNLPIGVELDASALNRNFQQLLREPGADSDRSQQQPIFGEGAKTWVHEIFQGWFLVLKFLFVAFLDRKLKYT